MVLSAIPIDLGVATLPLLLFHSGPHRKLRESELMGLIDDGTLKTCFFSGRFSFLKASQLSATSVSGHVAPVLLAVHSISLCTANPGCPCQGQQ